MFFNLLKILPYTRDTYLTIVSTRQREKEVPVAVWEETTEEVGDAGDQDENFVMEEREHQLHRLLLLLSGAGRNVYVTHPL